jgi:peptidoglycan/xylan/chitin deacetylase (PgdA/CDA1 family)
MRALCVTVDLDRDVNIHFPGNATAGSIDRGEGTAARFASSVKGLSMIVELFDSMGVKATFFAESATLREADASLLSGYEVGIHGVDHEDFTEIKGVEKKRAIIRESFDTVKDAVGKAPRCFRAPYMNIDRETMDILPEFGFCIDSSLYTELSSTMMPELMDNGIWEMPIPRGLDSNGKKIAAYLWPMHESRRKPEDYLEMASVMERGAFVLATHTWHIVESRERGKMTPDEIKKNIDNVRKVLEGIMDMGMRPLTMTDARKALE